MLEAKIPPPIVTLALAGAMCLLSPASAPPTHGSVLALFFSSIAIGSALLAATAFLSFWRAKTTINPLHPERASVLMVHGAFRLTRNPLYLSLALLLLAYAVHLGSLTALTGPLAFIAYITRFQIVPEERAMQATFGDAWTKYSRTVRRWI